MLELPKKIMPEKIGQWFSANQWQLHSHQEAMFAAFQQLQSALLIAPTGSGKTLASFLPSLVAIDTEKPTYLHTLYISPLKALTNDIERNLFKPINEIGLKVSVDKRTSDTSAYRRVRQKKKPPQILLTTPESLMLLLSDKAAGSYFENLQLVIIDELHSFLNTKRGDMAALALAQLKQLAKNRLVCFGLSATVAEPNYMARWLAEDCKIIKAKDQQPPTINLLTDGNRIPYTGIMAAYALPAIYEKIKTSTTTIVFVNTRLQAEFFFRKLWEMNTDNLAICVYHGSLSKEKRLKVEHLVSQQKLKAIIATSALELGIDWQVVDCVIQIGAPKGISRLLQRIGRSNHRHDSVSDAYLVPANCFELLECCAAMQAIAQGQRDGAPIKDGSLDVVIQFIMNCACAAPIRVTGVYRTVISALPYRDLSFATFKKLFRFVINGGRVLKHYDRYTRLTKVTGGYYQSLNARLIRRHRQNIGTIVEAARLRVMLRFTKRSRYLGEVEEAFIQQLAPGDTFLFAGEILSFVRVKDMHVEVKRAKSKTPKLPSYPGGSMPLSTHLASAVHALINHRDRWQILPAKAQEWLSLQSKFAKLPHEKKLYVETFQYKRLHYCIIYSFAGRQVNATLGQLMTREMETMGLQPLSFSHTDYGLAICSLRAVGESAAQSLLSPDLTNANLEEWLAQSTAMKRAFRQVALITGLTERKIAGEHKSMRQVTFSTDLIYDVLLRHENDHILLAITRNDVNQSLLDLERLQTWLLAVHQHLEFINLEKPSPLSLPIILALNKEKIEGAAIDMLLQQSQESEAIDLMAKVRDSVS